MAYMSINAIRGNNFSRNFRIYSIRLMKPVQNSTGFICCTFPAIETAKYIILTYIIIRSVYFNMSAHS